MMFGPPPDVPNLQEQIDENSNLKPVKETHAELDTLKERMMAALSAAPPAGGGGLPDDGFDDVFSSPDAGAAKWGQLISSDAAFEEG